MPDLFLIVVCIIIIKVGYTNKFAINKILTSVDIPYKIVNLIREFCDQFSVIIPFVAKSAATMIAIGADEIIMGPTSELGPIDPLVKHPKYEDMWIPVQSIRMCIDFMEEKLAQSTNPEMTTSLLYPILDKLDPWIIGDYEKSIKASYQYAETLLEKNMFKKNREKAKSLTRIMTEKYFSHGYCINRKEAIDELGLNVVQANGAMWNIIWALYLAYDDYMQNKDYSFIMEITDDIKGVERY